MQMRPEVQIASMLKAMQDVVIPALAASNNKPAVEQAQLVAGMLNLMGSQLPVQFAFDRDELARLLASADALKAIETGDGAARQSLQALSAASDEAAQVLRECRRDPAELLGAVRSVRESICQVVDSLALGGEAASQLTAEKILLAMSKEQLLRDRSLVKLQGWEPDPAAVPAIGQLLAGR